MWKRRQDVLNSKEFAEIAKIEAEREKAYQEGVALSRANRETSKETEDALEDKVLDAAIADNVAKAQPTTSSEVPSNGTDREDEPTSPSVDTSLPDPPLVQTIESEPFSIGSESEPQVAATESPTQEALETILAASETLSPQTRGVIEAVHAQEILAKVLRRSFPDGDVVRNVKVGGQRADFIVRTRDEAVPDLAVDIRVLPTSRRVSSQTAKRALEWAIKIRQSARSVFELNLHPVSVIILHREVSMSEIKAFQQELHHRIEEEMIRSGTRAPGTYLLLPMAVAENRQFTLDKSTIRGDGTIMAWSSRTE
jgi:hypothetical protein